MFVARDMHSRVLVWNGDAQVWTTFMTEVERLALVHPYVSRPSAKTWLNWLTSFACGEPILLCPETAIALSLEGYSPHAYMQGSAL